MITYLEGSAVEPRCAGPKIIAHVCNDIGAWGKGFVLAITEKWPMAEHQYRNWYQQNDYVYSNETITQAPVWGLGEVDFVKVEDNIHVANMIGQKGIMPKFGIPPIRYDALEKCLMKLAIFAKANNASVHMPRIGCGLAGGSWTNVEKLIEKTLSDVNVYVYDYNSANNDPKLVKWTK